MANVIRQDVIQVAFDVDSGGLTQINKDMDKLKSSVGGGVNDGITKLKTSLSGTTTEANKLSAAFKKVGGIDNLSNATEDLTQLNKKIEVQEKLCNNLAEEYKQVASEMGETSNKALKLKQNLLNQESTLTKMTRESKSLTSAIDTVKDATEKAKDSTEDLADAANDSKTSFKNLAKISFSALNTGLDKVATHITNIAKKAAGAAYTGLKKLAGISFKALTTGIMAVGTAVGGLVVKATQAYADNEQLVGGVETLFKGSAGTVQKYANNAYKTAGLSANEYMESVTGFSASLLQSLKGDTAKAAKYADMAISDMSDNANKMGTDMSMIQTTYQGFAKQNYTMLKRYLAA